MKYLVISDSHHRNDFVKYLINYYRNYEVIHLGDKKMDIKGINIRGNCDDFGEDETVIEINGIKTLITHGHFYQVKYTLEYIIEHAIELNCKMVLFGHTHKKFDQIINGIRLVNPGALQDGYYLLIDEEFEFKRLGE